MYIDARGQLRVGKVIVHAATVIILLALLIGSFGTVEAGSRGIKTRFSAVVGVMEPGLYFKLPFVEKVREMDVRTQTIAFEQNAEGSNALNAASSDLQDVAVAVTVNYHVDPAGVAEIYKQYTSTENYNKSVVEPMVRDSVKSAASQFTAEELVTKRAQFNDAATAILNQRLEGKLAILERLNITNLQFSATFTEAIESKVTAVQKAEAAKNQLEQIKYEAQQTIETAKANAESIRIQAQAINSQGGADYVELQRIEKWNGEGCTQYCGMDASTGLLIQR